MMAEGVGANSARSDDQDKVEASRRLAEVYRLLIERGERLAEQNTQDDTADPTLTLAGQTGPAADASLDLANQEVTAP